MILEELRKLSGRRLIHLTTAGRVTGRAHTVELWFALDESCVYLSHEGRATDWMKNIMRNGKVSFEIGGKKFVGNARVLTERDENAWEAKQALYEKYYGKAEKEVIEDWFSLSKLLVIEPSTLT